MKISILAMMAAIAAIATGLAADLDGKNIAGQTNKSGTATPGIQIIVNPGLFKDIDTAAVSEGQVNFWDDDLTDDDACTECFAATELRRFLLQCPGMEGRDVKLSWTNTLPDSGYIFVLGNRRSNPLVGCLDTAGGRKDELTTPESYRIRVVQQGARTVCVIEGKGRVGTLYGVHDYLERLGFRFFGLGDKGTIRPTAPCELIRELEVTENPAFLARGFHAWQKRGNHDFFLWMARNRLNYWTAVEDEIPLLKKLGMRLAVGGHVIQSSFLHPRSEYPYNYTAFRDDKSKPADPYKPSPEYAGNTNKDGKLSYFDAHPEWFGLRDGKRSDKIGREKARDNYCTSNDEATGELIKNFVQGLIDGVWSKADVVNFWMEDEGKWCEFDNCKQLGTPTDRLLLLVYKANEEVQKSRRDGKLKRNVHLTTLAYVETIAPPTRPLPEDFDYENCSVTFYPAGRCYVHALADPKCTEFNKGHFGHYSGWTTAKKRFYEGSMFIGEYYNVSIYQALPALYPHIMRVDIPMYYQTGARHFQYMHTLTQNWGTWTLNQYLMGRLLWNPKIDVDLLLNDYFARRYPTTARHTRAFYEYLETAFGNINALKGRLRASLNTGDLPKIGHLRYEEYHPAINDGPDLVEMAEAIRLARREIDQSLWDCSDPVEKLQLLEDERRFAYGEATVMFFYHITRAVTFDKRRDDDLARNEFSYLERDAEALRQFGKDMTESCIGGGFFDGFCATYTTNRYEALKERYGSAGK